MKKFIFIVLALVFAAGSVFAAEQSGFTPLKSKLGIGCAVTGDSASMRLWPMDNLGLEFSAGFSSSNNASSVPLSVLMLFPIVEKGNFGVNMAPGIGFRYYSDPTNSGFDFTAGISLMLEMALPQISESLSIGSGIGAWFTFNSDTQARVTATRFDVDIIKVTPVVVRYYF